MAAIWSVYKNLRHEKRAENSGKMRGRLLGRIIVLDPDEDEILATARKKWPHEYETSKRYGGFYFVEYTPVSEQQIILDHTHNSKSKNPKSALSKGVLSMLSEHRKRTACRKILEARVPEAL